MNKEVKLTLSSNFLSLNLNLDDDLHWQSWGHLYSLFWLQFVLLPKQINFYLVVYYSIRMKQLVHFEQKIGCYPFLIKGWYPS